MKNRPSIDDKVVTETVARRLASQLVLNDTSDELKNVYNSVFAVLDDTPEWNAYEIAKCLDDDFGWRIDDHKLNILGNASHYQYEEHKRLVEDWVQSNNIVPQFSWGDIVHFMLNEVKIDGRLYRRGDYKIGEIQGVRHNTAEYIINTDNHFFGCGYIIPYERCW